MKNTHLHIITAVLVLFTLASCNQDRDEIVSIDVSGPPFIEVKGAVGGVVEDANGNPISDVVVSFENSSAVTDENGIYFFDDIELNENGSNFTFRRLGFIDSYKNVKGRFDKRTFTKTIMLDKTPFENFDVASTFSIPLFGSGKITFPEGSIIDENNIAYSGLVSVILHEINPFQNDQLIKTPGDFRGISNQGFVQLESYGMFYVGVETLDGITLGFDTNNPPQFELPLLGGDPPLELALWYFDPNGNWVESGTATREFENQATETFRGAIPQTGFWNCDASFPAVRMEGRFIFPNENPISNRLLKIEQVNGGLTNYGYTDQDGFFAGFVPANSNLLLSILNEPDNCGILHQMDFLTGDGKFDLGVQIAQTDDPVSNPQISMRIIGCDTLSRLDRTYVELISETASYSFLADQNGEVKIQIPDCVDNFLLRAYDHRTANSIVAFSSQESLTEDLELDDVRICDPSNAFFNYTFLNEPYLSPFCNVTADGIIQFDNIPDSISSIRIRIDYDPEQINTSEAFPVSLFELQPDLSNPDLSFSCDGVDSCQLIMMFDQFDIESDFYQGNFSGTILNDGEPTPISGSFSTK